MAKLTRYTARESALAFCETIPADAAVEISMDPASVSVVVEGRNDEPLAGRRAAAEAVRTFFAAIKSDAVLNMSRKADVLIVALPDAPEPTMAAQTPPVAKLAPKKKRMRTPKKGIPKEGSSANVQGQRKPRVDHRAQRDSRQARP